MQHSQLDRISSETDFALWLAQQASAIRDQRWQEVDVAEVAEELEGLSNSQRHELRNRLDNLMTHLLKKRYQPERETVSWYVSISNQRTDIEGLLNDSPSLKPVLEEMIAKVYPSARRHASMETGLDVAAFPVDNPFNLDDMFRSRID